MQSKSGHSPQDNRMKHIVSKQVRSLLLKTIYAADRKAKVHTYGPKEGKELTDYEAGMRSGYLQAQSDHAGMFKYKKALAEGKSKSEAKAISQRKGK